MCQCPNCNSKVTRRKNRSGLLKLIPKTKMYKCYSCKAVFVRFSLTETKIIINSGLSSDTKVTMYSQ